MTEHATGALALGKAAHTTLAANFRRKMACGSDMELAEVR